MEPYHRQPSAEKANSKLKNAKKDGPYPPTISIVPYPPQQSPEEKKTCTVSPPTQASAQINSTGPTLHKAESHTEGKYDPARQRNSQRPGTPKINKTKDECNKFINTHTKHRLQKHQKKRKSHQKTDNIQRKENQYKTAKIKENPRLA